MHFHLHTFYLHVFYHRKSLINVHYAVLKGFNNKILLYSSFVLYIYIFFFENESTWPGYVIHTVYTDFSIVTLNLKMLCRKIVFNFAW